MQKALVLAALVFGAACSHDTAGPNGPTPELSANFTKGVLTLKIEDFVAPPGIFWALPSVTPAPGSVVVQSTRYGTLCYTAVDGSATVNGSHITLDINFNARTDVMCTQEIRAMRYTATIAAAPGSYDVTVVHHDGSQPDTLVKSRAVVVP